MQNQKAREILEAKNTLKVIETIKAMKIILTLEA